MTNHKKIFGYFILLRITTPVQFTLYLQSVCQHAEVPLTGATSPFFISIGYEPYPSNVI